MALKRGKGNKKRVMENYNVCMTLNVYIIMDIAMSRYIKP